MRVFAEDLVVELGYRLVDHQVTTASVADAGLSWTVRIATDGAQLLVVVLDPVGDEVRRWSLPRLERLELETRRAAVLIEGALRFDLEQLVPLKPLTTGTATSGSSVAGGSPPASAPGPGDSVVIAPVPDEPSPVVTLEVYGGLGARFSVSRNPKLVADLAASTRLGRWMELEAFVGSELRSTGPAPVAARQSWIGALVGVRVIDGVVGLSVGVGPKLVLLETRADSGEFDRRWQPSLRNQIRADMGITRNLFAQSKLSVDVLGRRPIYLVAGQPIYSPDWVQAGLTIGVGYRL